MPPKRLAALILVGAALACQDAGPDATETSGPSIDLTPCRLPGLDAEAQCGTLTVPVDRARPDGPTIDLNLALVRALKTHASPDPVFILAGGPGQSATEVGPQIVRALRKVRRERDFVLVDQRGTGKSSPMLCSDEDDAEDLRQMFGESQYAPVDLYTCLGEVEADPRYFTTDIAMDDLDAVREALGYETINLWGASYGTRAALVYMRRHPDRVRSAVLDSVAPPQNILPLYMARDGQRALDLLVKHCEEDEHCREAYPDLGADLDALLRRLRTDPQKVVVHHPRSGEPVTITVHGDVVAGMLRGLLYSAEMSSLVPHLVCEGLDGNFDPLVGTGVAFSQSTNLAFGMMLSVLCAEDVSRISDQELERENGGTFLGDTTSQVFLDACRVWPHADSGAAPDPVSSDAPVLLLSGELDPVTPPSWGDVAAETLPNSRHVVVPGLGHGVSSIGCVPDLIRQFIDTADPSGLEPDCVERHARPPFFLDFAGPQP